MSTPMSSSCRRTSSGGASLVPTNYGSVVGALQYLTITRPDISYAVNKVCQFKQTPSFTQLVVVKRIIPYIKETISHGLMLTGSPQ